MATEAQTKANRENAKKSTGPRTPEGKAISSRNSLVHGMTSGLFLPPQADPEEFFQLLDAFRERFQPFDEVEDALVERMAAAEFRMRTMRYLDAGLFHYQAEVNPIPKNHNKKGLINPLAWHFHYDSATFNSFTKLSRYEATLQREFSRALRDLISIQKDRRALQAEAEPHETKDPAPKKEKTSRTQFSPETVAPNGAFTPDPPQNPSPDPSPGHRGDPPKR